MGTMTVQDAVRHAVTRGELSPLFEHFSDDVEVAVTLDLPASAQRACRGRQSAIVSLGASDDARRPPREAQDVFGNDERIVALFDQGLATGPGLALRSECVLVLDLHEGAIARLAIHHELFPVLPAVAGEVKQERGKPRSHDDLAVAAGTGDVARPLSLPASAMVKAPSPALVPPAMPPGPASKAEGRHGATFATDGPFAETKEQMGGL